LIEPILLVCHAFSNVYPPKKSDDIDICLLEKENKVEFYTVWRQYFAFGDKNRSCLKICE
jgi:hypothetical protein